MCYNEKALRISCYQLFFSNLLIFFSKAAYLKDGAHYIIDAEEKGLFERELFREKEV